MNVLRIFSSIALALVLAACSPQPAPSAPQPSGQPAEQSATQPAAGAKKVIAFSQCNSAEPYRTAQNRIMEREIGKYPEFSLVIQDAQQDNARQIAQIENFILQKVSVLIVAPNEAAPLTEVVRSAKKAGIKVVCLERDIMDPEAYDVFVGADNVKIGEMAGQFVAEQLKERGVQNPVVVEMKDRKSVV